jgi:hypothetical protein
MSQHIGSSVSFRVLFLVGCLCGTVLMASSPAFADPPACPADSTETINGTMTVSGTTISIPLNLAPCQTVTLAMTTTGNTVFGASVAFKMFNSETTPRLLYEKYWSAYGPVTNPVLPTGAPWIPPYRGTRGVEGLPKNATLYATFFDSFGHTLKYSITVSKVGRPDYNRGGTSFTDAPLICPEANQYGSLHPWEPGQFYKVTLQEDEILYLTGKLTGSPAVGTNLYIDLYDSSQQYVTRLVSRYAQGEVAFPSTATYPTYTNPGPGAADFYLKATAGVWPVHDFELHVQTQLPTVTITAANIVTDEIKVSLSPGNLSGTLVVTAAVTPPTGAPITHTIQSVVKPSGDHTFSFNRQSLPLGQHTSIAAKWTPLMSDVTDTEPVSFLVMGDYRHSQYNTPNESQCVGAPDSAYFTNASCAFTSTTLKSDFIPQSWLNGSGVTISQGIEQNEAFCLNHGTPPANATGRSFRPQAIVPTCGGTYGVSGSTVAKGDDAPLTCGDQVLIVGLGGANAATVKSVTDRCPACTGHLQLDNYTTAAACQAGAIPDLGTFRTIRLR